MIAIRFMESENCSIAQGLQPSSSQVPLFFDDCSLRSWPDILVQTEQVLRVVM